MMNTLPQGWRWATPEEVEAAIASGDYSQMLQVRVGGTDEDPWTDLAVKE